MRFSLLFVVVTVFCGMAVVASPYAWSASEATQIAQVDEAQAEKERSKKKNKRVCKRVKTTGSRIPERVCRKQSEWDRMRDNARENAQQTFNERNRASSVDG